MPDDYALKVTTVSPHKRRLELEAAPTLLTQVQALIHRVLNGADPPPAAARPRPPRRPPRVRPARPVPADLPERRCTFCANPFAPRSPSQLYCSPQCREKQRLTTRADRNGAVASV